MGRAKKIVTEYRNYDLPTNFPIICLTGDRWRISDVRSDHQHFHNCFEIGICHSDTGYMEFFGKPYPFRAGDITCIPKNIPHTTYSSPGESSLWSYVFFNPTDLLKDVIPASSRYMDFETGAFSDHFLHVTEKDNPFLHTLVLNIVKEMSEQKPYYQSSVKGLLLSFCIEMLRYAGNTVTENSVSLKKSTKSSLQANSEQTDSNPGMLDASKSANSNVLAPALDFIEKNYMLQFTVEDLANQCHLSETHFRRIFNACIGNSPLDFVTYTRVMAACNLLRNTEDSILGISESVGFHSVSSFNRAFQKIMNQAPREYRNEMIARDQKIQKQSIVEYTGWL